jgi:hypothetical protein
MNLYDEIIKERSSKSSLRKSSLLDIERSRAYELRINQLSADLRDIEMKIGNYEGKLEDLVLTTIPWYVVITILDVFILFSQFGHLDADLNSLKAKLCALTVSAQQCSFINMLIYC